MIVGVGYYDSVCITDCDVMGVFKVTRFAAHDAKFAHKGTIGLENLKRGIFFSSENHFGRLQIIQHKLQEHFVILLEGRTFHFMLLDNVLD